MSIGFWGIYYGTVVAGKSLLAEVRYPVFGDSWQITSDLLHGRQEQSIGALSLYTMADFKFMARALRHRNYRLFFGGQGVSLVGTWMQQVALSWLVYRLTNSPLLLGLVGFAGQLPTFLLTSFAGVLADRWPRLRLLIVIQTLAAIQASILAFLTLTGRIAIWHIFVLGICMGVIIAFDVPIRQSLVADMIENKEDLGNAIALNSFLFNGARLIGPSIAGLLLSVTSEGVCFLLNAVSFIAVIAALAAMRIPRS